MTSLIYSDCDCDSHNALDIAVVERNPIAVLKIAMSLDMDTEPSLESTYKPKVHKTLCFLYAISALIFGLLVGVSLTYTVMRERHLSSIISWDPTLEDNIRLTLFDRIKSQRIESNLKSKCFLAFLSTHNVFISEPSPVGRSPVRLD